MKQCVYNLEFPPYCNSLTIQGYIFTGNQGLLGISGNQGQPLN